LTKPQEIIEQLGGKEYLQRAIVDSTKWIEESFEINQNRGSSGSRSLFGKWSDTYPETTGYLLSTIINSKVLTREQRMTIASSQYFYFKERQNNDGSFFRSDHDTEPVVFDTAQILLGLMSLLPMVATSKELYEMCQNAYAWLVKQLDDQGYFKNYNYVEDYNPSYYARVAWPILQWEMITEKKALIKTLTLINRIAGDQNENYSFSNWGFYKDTPAYTHTIAYTLRGLWECSELLNEKTLFIKTEASLKKLVRVIEKKGRVAGTYDTKWNGDHSFICGTGNAQLAWLFMRVYQLNRDEYFLKPITILLSPLIKAQRKFYTKGAVPSSIPIWGPYQRFKFTNWTQKFYVEALSKLLKL